MKYNSNWMYPELLCRVIEWYANRDRGLSSESIVVQALWLTTPEGTEVRDLWRHPEHPRDTADLGRCVRLLEKIPELRDLAFERLSKKSKPWRGLIKHWDELVSLYHEEADQVRAEKDWVKTLPPLEAKKLYGPHPHPYPYLSNQAIHALTDRTL